MLKRFKRQLHKIPELKQDNKSNPHASFQESRKPEHVDGLACNSISQDSQLVHDKSQEVEVMI